MAEYYVDTSATYDGDGTASTGAASAGAAGAANDILSLLSNTHAYVTLAAGDTVYIRTGTGASFEKTLTVSKTTLNASHTAPLTWVFDDGTIWASPGTITFQMAYNYTITFGRFNVVRSTDTVRRGIFQLTTGATSGGPYSPVSLLKGARINDSIIRSYDATSDGVNRRTVCVRQQDTSGTDNILYNCELDMVDYYDATYAVAPYYLIQAGRLTIDGCEIKTRTDDTNMSLAARPLPYFQTVYIKNTTWSQRNDAAPIGNPGDETGIELHINNLTISGSTDACFLGMETWYSAIAPEGSAAVDGRIFAQGINGFGVVIDDGISLVDYNPAGNYPYRDASIYGGTGWSYRVSQRWGSAAFPAVLGDFVKQLTAASGTKTLTVELLINNNYTNVDDAHFWLEVTYQDASGNFYHETGRNLGTPNALAAGSGGWSATTYASQSYTSKKLTLTTSNSIGQYTPISVRVRCSQTRPSTTGFFFIDPSVGIS